MKQPISATSFLIMEGSTGGLEVARYMMKIGKSRQKKWESKPKHPQGCHSRADRLLSDDGRSIKT